MTRLPNSLTTVTHLSPELAAAIRELVRSEHNQIAQRPSQQKRRHVTLSGPGVMIGKTNSAITKGSSGSVSRYRGSSGAEEDTGIDDVCKNKFVDLDADMWVAYVSIGGTFYMIAAECPEE